MWFVSPGGLVEHNEVLLHHGAELVNGLLPVRLHTHCCRVSAGVRVLTTNHSSDTGLLFVSGRRVSHISTKKDHRFVENLARKATRWA